MRVFDSAIKDVIQISWPTLVIVLAITAILRITYLVKGDKRSFCLHNEIMNLLFMTYILMLFELVTSQDLTGGGMNLTPFKEILRYKVGSSLFFKQVVGNIVIFAPLGFFAARYCKIKDFLTMFVISLLSSATIESVQYFIGRSFDIDDIILNVVGGIIGFLIFIALNAINNHMPKVFRKDWFYNIICIIIMVLVGIYFINIF